MRSRINSNQRLKFQFGDEPVKFVENENRFDVFLPRLLQDDLGLRLNTLDDVDDDDGAVAKTNGCRHFTEKRNQFSAFSSI